MNILSITLDPAILDTNSPAFMRQEKYYEGHKALCILLKSGKKQEIVRGDLRIIQLGGAFKLSAFIKAWRFAMKESLKQQFTLVLTQDVLLAGLLGYKVAHKRNIPLVTQLHGDYLDNPLWTHEKLHNRILNKLGKNILRKSDGVRVVSSRILNDATKRFNIPAEKIISIPIGTDLSVFSDQGEKATDAPTVLFVGRLIAEKSPLLFCKVAVDLMKKYPKLQAAVAGTGNLQPRMAELFDTAEFGDRVKFLGNLSAPELSKWYRASICLIHTAAWEGWGMPMIEAMACGCPVVTTDSGCAKEAVIDGRNGMVVPVDDERGLLEATERLVTNLGFETKLRAQAVIDAKDWSFDSLKTKLVAFYEQFSKKA